MAELKKDFFPVLHPIKAWKRIIITKLEKRKTYRKEISLGNNKVTIEITIPENLLLAMRKYPG